MDEVGSILSNLLAQQPLLKAGSAAAGCSQHYQDGFWVFLRMGYPEGRPQPSRSQLILLGKHEVQQSVSPHHLLNNLA